MPALARRRHFASLLGEEDGAIGLRGDVTRILQAANRPVDGDVRHAQPPGEVHHPSLTRFRDEVGDGFHVVFGRFVGVFAAGLGEVFRPAFDVAQRLGFSRRLSFCRSHVFARSHLIKNTIDGRGRICSLRYIWQMIQQTKVTATRNLLAGRAWPWALGLAVAGGLTANVQAALEGETRAAASPDKSTYNLFNPTPRELMREMSTDRPDQTESPYTVDAGHFQMEMDFVKATFDRDKSAAAKCARKFGASLRSI